MAETPTPPDAERYQQAARAWLAKGSSDLRSAKALLALDPPETEAVAFHCQQAAEKNLKGFLAYHGEEPPRTHDLSVLLDLALDRRAELEPLRASARFLIPYAVEVRYPFAGQPPTEEEAREAVEHARAICERTRGLVFPDEEAEDEINHEA